MFLLQTPGAGGFGEPESESREPDRKKKRLQKEAAGPALSTVGRGSVYDYQRTQESV